MAPLDVDLTGLQKALKKMGATPVDFSVRIQPKPIGPVGGELGTTGIVLTDLSEVDTSKGLLNYKGRQILLYIQDQGNQIEQVLQDGSMGKKFHIADCTTLKEMREKGRFERYVVTQNLEGVFPVSGTDWKTGRLIEGEAGLWVCKNCLKFLNYQGAAHGNRDAIARKFDITEFFSTYSSFFPHLPRRRAGQTREEGYTEDWSRIGGAYKADKGFKCESCGVDLSAHKNLLHVHHKNGVKGDNSRSNLQALCLSCHREQPNHEHLFVRHQDAQIITRLRGEQGILASRDWAVARRYCDPGLSGLLAMVEKLGASAPEVGVDILDATDAIVANLEIAWPERRVGVAIQEEDIEAGNKAGWRVWSMIDALQASERFVAQTRSRS
jgi:hypothetical protein